MSITIIGCGWLGVPLGNQLIQQNYEVNGSVRNETGFDALREAGIKPFQLDLKKTTEVPKDLIDSTKVLIVTVPPLYRDEPNKYKAILNELLNQFSDDVRVIFSSSTGIYPKEAANYTENFAFTQEQNSSILNVAENAIRQSSKAHVIFRLGGLIGPNRHPIRFLAGRKNVKNPLGPINFVHQGDCVKAIIHSIENSKSSGTFNLVFPDHPSRKNYYVAAAKQYGLSLPEFKEEEAVDRLISSEKIKAELGFNFDYPINDFPELKLK